jgi:hypothetical protein
MNVLVLKKMSELSKINWEPRVIKECGPHNIINIFERILKDIIRSKTITQASTKKLNKTYI